MDCFLHRTSLTLILAIVWFGLTAGGGIAASSEAFTSKAVTATIISAQNGVPPGAETLSAGLSLELAEDWKTYWRSPGEVGIPPQIAWSRSVDVADVEMLWPAPERFTAFGIENFGYHGDVVFPLKITLKEPGKPVVLAGEVKLLLCSDVCVPQSFDLVLSLPQGTAIDSASASRIGDFLARVPSEGDQTGITRAIASVDEKQTALTLEMQNTTAFDAPDVFAELGAGTALGKPDIRLGDGGRRLWARIPILTVLEEQYHDPILTVTDGPGRALTLTPQLDPIPPNPPFNLEQLVPGLDQLAWVAIIAFLGGMILNVMPCVLPVLSIKLSSAIKAQGRNPGSVRRGFLVAAAGIMVFMWSLAAILYALQLFGFVVGWGLQFQNPVFLTLMFLVLAVFSANLLGLFEFRLPSGLQSRFASAGGSTGYGADFATGFFGAVLATPCSAPFLGTAIAFALGGRGIDILIVFSALGLGLAAPYLFGAAFPGLVTLLPKPGRWMIWLKLLLGLLLLGTSLWLAWVLVGVAGPQAAAAVIGSTLILMLILSFRPSPSIALRLSIILFIALPLVSVGMLARSEQPAQSIAASGINWIVFDRGDIARRISRGEVVFLDVTADWCLTCKANKALVLERDPVLTALRAARTVAMQADWTQPDERIARFLEANNRYGIPFNAVYGPAAPNGIVLSEILSSQEVLMALETARGTSERFSAFSIGQ